MLFAGCSTIVTTPPANCSEFIPPSWKVPVESAPLPKEDTAQDWQGFGVGQTGQLVKANGRQADTVHIFETCERRANDARPRKKFLGIF
jgi:hypothetical protein